MPELQVWENPTRRRRRRRTRRRATSRRRRRSTRRRNPALATLSGNPRHRRSYKRRYYRRGRRRRNPFLSTGRWQFADAGWITAGMILPRVVTPFITRFLPLAATQPIMQYAVKGGAVWLSSFLVKMVTRNRRRSDQVMLGGVASILFDVFMQYVAPRVGLAGLGGFVTSNEMENAGITGFIRTPTNLGRYADVSQDIMAV